MNSTLSSALAASFPPGGQTASECTVPTPPPANRWADWDAFVESNPASGFMQTSWWADFRSTCGFENFGVTFKNGGEILGGAVVLKFFPTDDSCFYYIPHGPVLPADSELAEAVFHATLEAIDEHRQAESCLVTHLRIEPRWTQLPAFVTDFRPVAPFADPYLEPRDTRVIDLRPSEDAILAQMKPKGRYNIHLAQRHGVSIVEDISPQGLADFISLHDETAARQGMEAKPEDYFQALVSLLLPNRRVSIFFAEYQGLRLAAALVIYFGRTAIYFFGGSRDLHREVMAPYVLHFEIMRKAKSLGHEFYDLWGIAPPNDPDHPWANISTFKAKFGGSEVHYVPTLDLIYDDATYTALRL